MAFRKNKMGLTFKIRLNPFFYYCDTKYEMLKTIFMYIWLLYIVLTQSLFMQFLAIFIFYVASKIAHKPTNNWYYPKEETYD